MIKVSDITIKTFQVSKQFRLPLLDLLLLLKKLCNFVFDIAQFGTKKGQLHENGRLVSIKINFPAQNQNKEGT